MTTASDGAPAAPAALRIARAITTTQSAVAAVITAIALLAAVTAKHSDDVARRAGHPHQFEGLGAGIAAFLALVCGLIALASGAASIGLCHSRTWGLVTAGVTETVILLVAIGPAAGGAGLALFVPVILPSATALACVASPKSRAWCRARTLA